MIGMQEGNQIRFTDDEGNHLSYDTIDGDIVDIVNRGEMVVVLVQGRMGNKQMAIYKETWDGKPNFVGYRAI